MNCAACGAPHCQDRDHCPVCGRTDEKNGPSRWDRAPEALLYENLQTMLKDGETLLSATRGRIGGSWRSRANFSPFAFMAPYANVGLTGTRVLVQQVHPRTGEVVDNSGADVPLTEVAAIQASDADPFEPGHTVRLTIVRNDGESFRIRAVGRLAEAATGLAGVWETISNGTNGTRAPQFKCATCGRSLDRAYRFCPFCGTEQGA